MGAIAAALSKHGDDVVPIVIAMLEALVHRGAGKQEVITPNRATSARSPDELRITCSMSSSVSVGRNASETNRRDYEPLTFMKHCAVVFEGQAFPQHPTYPFSQGVASHQHLPYKTARTLLRDFDGHYAFVAASSNEMLVGRDPVGVMPLYYGETHTLYAVASERKALWKIGATNVQSFPPGNMAMVNREGFTFKPVSTIRLQPQRKTTMHEAARRLQKLLEKSIQERVIGLEKVGVGFSGGLDSSVIARIAQNCRVSVNLISVGLEGKNELASAEKAAKTLGLPITVQTFKRADVERELSKVLWLIEEPDVMKVGVAIPFFWTAQMASKRGCHVLLVGQGADELFGGYHRYLTVYAKHGARKVAETLYDDTVKSYETNFQRDEPVSTFHKVDMRFPFADIDVVRFALGLPIDLKIESQNDGLRKRILRQVAKNLGIPAIIADRPKKAIQFASGVDRALRDMAKSKGLTPREYVEEVFRTLYPWTRE